MQMEIPKSEAEADLAATLRDKERLADICEALTSFISDSRGENRSSFRVDLLKFESLLCQAVRLEGSIKSLLETLQ